MRPEIICGCEHCKIIYKINLALKNADHKTAERLLEKFEGLKGENKK